MLGRRPGRSGAGISRTRACRHAPWVRYWLVAAGLAFLLEGAFRLATQFEGAPAVVSRAITRCAADFRPFLRGFATGIVSVLLLSGHLNDPVQRPAGNSVG